MRTDTGQTVYLRDYAPTPYGAPRTTLMFALHPTRTVVKNTTRYEPRGEGAVPLVLAGDGLTLLAAELDGAPLDEGAFEAAPDRFTLHAPPRRAFDLTLTTLVSPDDNTELMGLYRSGGVYCTQCEAEGFRRITYAYDRPDVLSVYDVFLMADGEGSPALLSNGNPVARGTMDGRASAQWHDPFPKPTYLFALVAGDLGVVRDTFLTASGREVALAIYVERGKEPRAGYAMDALKRSMRWDEQRFGLEYDLDEFNIVAVSDFNMGAMENKGLNVFNDRYILADPKVATDQDYAGIERVVAHEYFHNFTGNRITCRDWFQLCLKEGLTVFRDQEFVADERSRAVERIASVRRLRALQFPEDAGPLAHAVRPSAYDEISNLYTATVYDKGAELVRMIHTMVGETAFREGMATYVERHDGTAATVEDFVACFPLADPAAFMRWYETPGTPTVEVEETFADGRYALTLRQHRAEGAGSRPIPVRLALLTATGALDPARATVSGGGTGPGYVLVTDETTITVDRLDEPPVASVLRGFSAPVRIERGDDPARDLALIERDDDPFTVWDAVQRLSIAALRTRYDGGDVPVDALAGALGRLAADGRAEPAFRAYALAPPTRQALVEAIGADVDADRLEATHRDFGRALGTAMADALEPLAARHRPAPDDVSPAAAGARALVNGALMLLTLAGRTGAARTSAREATNMTDRLAALGALAAAEDDALEEALARFERDFAHEPLVMDKWFALQAMRTDGDPLERARGLTAHAAFTFKNPNRVRSLYGAFAQNLPAFHRADGEGYRFLADAALSLDGSNPQVAARLLTAFNDARRYEAARRSAAEAVLGDVLSRAQSSDVADIARRLTRGTP